MSISYMHKNLAKVYVDNILGKKFNQEVDFYIDHLWNINCAHTIMLFQEEIISKKISVKILRALRQIDLNEITQLDYEVVPRDFYFSFEDKIIEIAGRKAGGNIHIGRSRNDIEATLLRMVLREQILKYGRGLKELFEQLISLAEKHVNTVIPGLTHTQHAQPITFGHYLLAVINGLKRRIEQLIECYHRVNVCPMGATAFAGTSFPINRKKVASLLGFQKPQINAYDSVAAADHIVEGATILVNTASILSRFISDLLQYITFEFNALRLPDKLVQPSSIMPQKRNPVVLEHLRGMIGDVIGKFSSIVLITHNIPLTDTDDINSQISYPLWGLFQKSLAIVEVFKALIPNLEINKEVLKKRTEEDFSTTTELVDTLVRDYDLSFRDAYKIVSKAVGKLYENSQGIEALDSDLINSVSKSLGHKIEINDALIEEALDPLCFVKRRNTLGGTSPSEVIRQLTQLKRWIDKFGLKLDHKIELLERIPQELNKEVDTLLNKE